MIGIVFNLLKDLVLSIASKIAFKVILERFMSRLLVYSLVKLSNYTTNDVVEATIVDVINNLEGKKLKVIDEESKDLINKLKRK